MYHLRHMSWLTFSTKNLTNVFMFMYILPDFKNRFKIAILKIVEIILEVFRMGVKIRAKFFLLLFFFK